jgi:hypothetical protein
VKVEEEAGVDDGTFDDGVGMVVGGGRCIKQHSFLALGCCWRGGGAGRRLIAMVSGRYDIRGRVVQLGWLVGIGVVHFYCVGDDGCDGYHGGGSGSKKRGRGSEKRPRRLEPLEHFCFAKIRVFP